MIDLEPLERANKVLERLFKLDDAIANARAFRALLENLHGRDLSVVKEPHIAAIFMVRAEFFDPRLAPSWLAWTLKIGEAIGAAWGRFSIC